MTEKCVIIGLGQIGMEYDYEHNNSPIIFSHAKAIKKHSQFQLVGAVDISDKQRSNFEIRFSLPTYHDLELALKKLKPDVVVIATPTETHSSILKNVINIHKPKIILCEKPLAYELAVAKNMVEICENEGVDLFVNYMRRVDQGVLEIKRRIETGEIITPIKANVWYSKGIINNGSHFINLLNFWLGDMNSSQIINEGHLLNKFDPEPDFKLEFNLGVAIFRAAWEESFSHSTIELLSHTGRLIYDRGGEHIEWQAKSEDPFFKGYNTLEKNKQIIKNSMKIYQWQTFDHIYKYLNGQKTTLCTGFEALKTLRETDIIINQIGIK